tara:strand:+ start:2096 stop:2728 length:633 start_codon:yes stop_codon:yes gene_type:complete
MARYPDNHFDLAIVDPPYGIGKSKYTRPKEQYGNSQAKQRQYDKDWDNETPNKEYFNELKRVSKNQIIWGANHFIENIPNSNSSCWLVWDKQNGNNDFADCELAYASFNSAVRKLSFRWHGMLQQDMKNKEQRIHPTQKPRQLYNWILDTYAKEGDRILDTHLGSGSIALACHERGFNLTACELDKEYFEASIKRFKQQTAQQTIFDLGA